jgi:signal transduction histidine kinase
MKKLKYTGAWRISFLYLILGMSWIFFSDKVLLIWIEDIGVMQTAQTHKGWFYVMATAILLFFLIRNSLKRQGETRAAYLSELEQALKKARESDELKTAFLNNLSHEIRTPMNSILGFTKLLQDQSKSEKERQVYFQAIHDNGFKLLDVITDIVSIAAIESGQERIHTVYTDLNELFADLDHEFAEKAELKGVHFSCQISLQPDEAKIYTDRGKLNVVMSHLIRNAVKFTDEGKIECRCHQKDDTLHFIVSDTGRGISPEFNEVIFQRFRQADPGPSRLNEGIGLGLPISKAYVDMMGGNLWVESQPGRGSIFHFYIPYVPVSNAAPTSENHKKPH